MEENVIGVFKERRYHLYLQIFPKYVTVKWGEYIQGNFTIYLSSSSTFFQASAFAYCQRQHTGPDRLLVWSSTAVHMSLVIKLAVLHYEK